MSEDLFIILVYAGYFSAFMLAACILGFVLEHIPNGYKFIEWVSGYPEIFEEEEEED